MAKDTEKKQGFVEHITPRDVDFSQWYTDAVSYTHLDVYKRQPRARNPTRPRRATPHAPRARDTHAPPATTPRAACPQPHAPRTYHAPCQLAFFAFWCMMVL